MVRSYLNFSTHRSDLSDDLQIDHLQIIYCESHPCRYDIAVQDLYLTDILPGNHVRKGRAIHIPPSKHILL